MARRDRVPRHKSHSHKRNTNAKLSPFQREQKRARLANQPPTLKSQGTDRDIPHSQRRLFEYLQARRQREEERKQRLQQEAEEDGEGGMDEAQEGDDIAKGKPGVKGRAGKAARPSAAAVGSSSSVVATSADGEAAATAVDPVRAEKSKKAKHHVASAATSLNAEFSSTVGPAIRAFREIPSGDAAKEDHNDNRARTTEEIIARKKARKHERKVELRRQRVSEQLRGIEEQLQDLAKAKGRKKKKGDDREAGDFNLAFERKLRELQREDAARKAAEKSAEKKAEVSTRKRRRDGAGAAITTTEDEPQRSRQRSDDDDDDGGHHRGNESSGGEKPRKSISFAETVDNESVSLPHRAMRFPGDVRKGPRKPKEFYELVDVVRYGERVEAPPVFDVVPNRHAAVSRLANKLERESGDRNDRLRMLSSVGGLGEQKRLARLGLAPAVTGNVKAVGQSTVSKEREMEILRARVMATYQKNRRSEIEKKKGVDMKHSFPQFSS